MLNQLDIATNSLHGDPRITDSEKKTMSDARQSLDVKANSFDEQERRRKESFNREMQSEIKRLLNSLQTMQTNADNRAPAAA